MTSVYPKLGATGVTLPTELPDDIESSESTSDTATMTARSSDRFVNRDHLVLSSRIRVAANESLAIVLIEDSRIDAQLFREAVCRSETLKCKVTEFTNLSTAIAYLTENTADLVVLDLHLPDSEGLNTFRTVQAASESPIVVLSGEDNYDVAMEALGLGAQDFLVKGSIDMHTLTRAMQFACQRARLQRVERAFLRQQNDVAVLGQIQANLLPSRPEVTLDKGQFSAAVFPAEQAGGDYCDVVFSSPSRCNLIVADVSGHGLRASQSMLAVRATLRALCSQLNDPLEIMRTTEELLADDLRIGDHFVTLFLAVVDLDAATITYTSAGHAGYLLHADRQIESLDAQVPPIGTIEIAWNETHRTVAKLQPGDLLCLPTDGLVESSNHQGALFGTARMLETLETLRELPAKEIISRIVDRVTEFRHGWPQEDDLTILLMKYLPDAMRE